MKTIRFSIIITFIIFAAVISSCKKDPEKKANFTFEITALDSFFIKYPDYKPYAKEMTELYQKHEFHYIWYDKDGRIDLADVLYNKSNQIAADGVIAKIPYKANLDKLFNESENKSPQVNKDLLVSALYFFYTKKVMEGVDPQKSKETGWYLPRVKVSYVDYLDTLMKDPGLIKKDESEMISQYYKLKKGLKRYRDIQQKGGWGTITLPEGIKSIKENEISPTVAQVRKRLFITGDLSADSQSATFDTDLKNGLANYQKRYNRKPDNLITPNLVKEMSISVEERIKTIIVNMERCRWIDPDIAESKELIAVNIPSYTLQYRQNNKVILTSNVVVGKDLNKTVVFSGQMSYIVFSPYWNIPTSILEKEIKPGIDKDANYLEKHNMEWNGNQVRQKPGAENSLGLIKFMFPNSNNIYLHDTPAKSLFGKDNRAFSHGCVRVEKARDLAIEILKNDKNWTPAKIDAAMHTGKESQYSLKRKIPVYIAYFTAWADDNGNVSFYDDVYNRDGRLANLLYTETAK
ncbi:MAG: L,D-transpeptidase family protein [Flavobacterium sp.]|nr:L,D-transpeptidase family protein [Flavobacterium sp.]